MSFYHKILFTSDPSLLDLSPDFINYTLIFFLTLCNIILILEKINNFPTITYKIELYTIVLKKTPCAVTLTKAKFNNDNIFCLFVSC